MPETLKLSETAVALPCKVPHRWRSLPREG